MREEQETVLVMAVREMTAELRRSRRWRMLVGILPIVILVWILMVVMGQQSQGVSGSEAHTAMIDISGIIMPDAPAGADTVVLALRNAFEEEQAKGIILRINSPGGSPVQAQRIIEALQELRVEYPDKPVYAVAEDLCASAGYYIAVGADEIHASAASLVGSIGVIASGFGMVDLIERWGIERRITKSGEYKDMLDPFLPEDPREQAHVQELVDELHQQFVATVVSARGERLTSDEDLFDGRLWSGTQAQQLGLIDGFSSVEQLAREQIGAEEVWDYTYEPDLWEQFGDRLGSRLGQWLQTRLRTLELY